MTAVGLVSVPLFKILNPVICNLYPICIFYSVMYISWDSAGSSFAPDPSARTSYHTCLFDPSNAYHVLAVWVLTNHPSDEWHQQIDSVPQIRQFYFSICTFECLCKGTTHPRPCTSTDTNMHRHPTLDNPSEMHRNPLQWSLNVCLWSPIVTYGHPKTPVVIQDPSGHACSCLQSPAVTYYQLVTYFLLSYHFTIYYGIIYHICI